MDTNVNRQQAKLERKNATAQLTEACKESITEIAASVEPELFGRCKRQLKSKWMQSEHGRKLSQLKVANKAFRVAGRVLAHETARDLAKEHTQMLLDLSNSAAEKARNATNNVLAHVGVGVGHVVRSFRDAGASISAGYKAALNPSLVQQAVASAEAAQQAQS